MGGSDNNVQPQQQVGVAYPYAQPQQQNLYFQPQYVPQAAVYHEQPVLQGSSMYPNVGVPQHQPIIYAQAVPQPAYPVESVQPQVAEQPQAPRACRFSCSKLKNFISNLDAYRVCSFLTIMSFVFYFLFTPHAWPWFLTVTAVCAGFCGTKYIKATRMIADQEPRLFVHAIWYSALNSMFVLTNLWEGRYPWSVFPLCIWGCCLALHALKVYNNNQFKTRLYSHFIIYIACVIMILVAATRGRRTNIATYIVLGVWSLIVVLHAKKVKRDEARRASGDQQPAELQVVTDAAVPQQQNEAENAQLVQNQQEVFNSIHQAQQDQRAQQNVQVHLFQQPSVYPNTN